MVVLAAPGVAVGDLTITGRASSPDTAVTVNGEPATSGRTLFSSGVIKTPEGLTAVLNLGKAGKIRLDPSSTFSLSVSGDAVSGDLMDGNLTVINAAEPVSVKTNTGAVVKVSAGETASSSTSTPTQTKTGPGGANWGVWAALIGGAAFATILIWHATSDSENTSPTR
jgi:hypothetical protein